MQAKRAVVFPVLRFATGEMPETQVLEAARTSLFRPTDC